MSTVVKADFKSDVISSCKAYQQGDDKSEINACKLYIDGFIDSSLLNDDGVVKPKAMIERTAPEQSDFLKRAYRTRVLTTSSMLSNEEAYQFCIPREYDRKEIASSIAKSMDINQLADKQLKQVIFETLIADFPC
ncbi:hypothetical protein H4J51_17075 [Colwellia sp. MB02u-18]|uniref:Rap1a/Tai family immunity protein n=1 Tax=unclassified Colwellia TaxID=196834 RepID=UPI0015F68C14|nr:MULTISPECIES: Rap1a/Tai family immunity protein [unclassified Colwellia]MBA6224439.1 hypothetical protein [Colwellia sp. MB3u-45]MBA6267691.1 hypothetical protein [Colwellia sp. MB3u-43]MBA6322133.1 hypothetical protein [Colwellia sp. MB02u-19]MBA6326279.1 hypothetical protein [Colwellia sp. MB02u-18]MBA6331738.1 hypothetical protein [Colwellia sp. MB02u-12]